MKILHTADWHIGKRLDNYLRIDEQREVLNEICNIADEHNVDAIVIAGDIFDTYKPAVDAIDLLYKTLNKLSKGGRRLVCAIAGNHDSAALIKSADPLALSNGIILVGSPNDTVNSFETEYGIKCLQTSKGFIELKLPKYEYPLRLIHTPYANEARMRTAFEVSNSHEELQDTLKQMWQDTADKFCDNKGVNFMTSHLLVCNSNTDKIVEPDDEKPILFIGGAKAILSSSIPKQIQYLALGHLHRHQYIQKNGTKIVYSGSPLSYSFAEANQDKFVDIVSIEPNTEAQVEQVKIDSGKRLLRETFESVESACEWLRGNTDALVEISIKTNNYLTANERKLLEECHPGIINIIPLLSDEKVSGESTNTPNLNNSINELMIQYFKHKNNGLAPSDEHMKLFNEILSIK